MLIVQPKKATPPLHFAALKGHLAVVKCLVDEYNADVNYTTQTGNTSLHLAARKPSSEPHKKIRELLFPKSDTTIKNKAGKTYKDIMKEEITKQVEKKKAESLVQEMGKLSLGGVVPK